MNETVVKGQRAQKRAARKDPALLEHQHITFQNPSSHWMQVFQTTKIEAQYLAHQLNAFADQQGVVGKDAKNEWLRKFMLRTHARTNTKTSYLSFIIEICMAGIPTLTEEHVSQLFNWFETQIIESKIATKSSAGTKGGRSRGRVRKKSARKSSQHWTNVSDLGIRCLKLFKDCWLDSTGETPTEKSEDALTDEINTFTLLKYVLHPDDMGILKNPFQLARTARAVRMAQIDILVFAQILHNTHPKLTSGLTELIKEGLVTKDNISLIAAHPQLLLSLTTEGLRLVLTEWNKGDDDMLVIARGMRTQLYPGGFPSGKNEEWSHPPLPLPRLIVGVIDRIKSLDHDEWNASSGFFDRNYTPRDASILLDEVETSGQDDVLSQVADELLSNSSDEEPTEEPVKPVKKLSYDSPPPSWYMSGASRQTPLDLVVAPSKVQPTQTQKAPKPLPEGLDPDVLHLWQRRRGPTYHGDPRSHGPDPHSPKPDAEDTYLTTAIESLEQLERVAEQIDVSSSFDNGQVNVVGVVIARLHTLLEFAATGDFEELGAAWETWQTEVTKALSGLDSTLQLKTGLVTSLESVVQSKQQRVEELVAEVGALQMRVEEATDVREGDTAELLVLDRHRALLREEVKSKDTTIEELRARVAELEARKPEVIEVIKPEANPVQTSEPETPTTSPTAMTSVRRPSLSRPAPPEPEEDLYIPSGVAGERTQAIRTRLQTFNSGAMKRQIERGFNEALAAERSGAISPRKLAADLTKILDDLALFDGI